VAITFAEPREQRLLHNIERVTRQRIEIAPVPSIADLRARRLETTRAGLRDTLSSGSLEAYRRIAESLAEEFDPLDVAAAALKRAEPPADGASEEEIPSAAPPPQERRERHEPARPAKGRPQRAGRMERIFIGAGRMLRVTPGDLVGAITNEAGIGARSIGTITITERHAIVEVAEALVDDIIEALRASTIKGKRVTIRRYQP
jgi:ATP-dependent RNA helicase DeaD